MKPLGPTFGDELIEAGLGGLAISWTPDGTITGRENLTPQQDAALQAVIDAHDPTKQTNVIPVDEFIGRFTNAEYRAAIATAWRQTAGNAKNWDVVVFDAGVDLHKKKTTTLKTSLVTDGILTQARADVIFS